MNQKGFIQIPFLIAIISAVVSMASLGTGIVLFEQQKTPFFTANISDAIYKVFYEGKFKTEELKQELELSKFKEKKAEEERVEAENTAKHEIFRRGQAEARARQEEFEKKLKEQELLEKEAEEQKMSADNDGDGLTNREELVLGTSDYSTDFDNDGINDKEDSHPAGGDRLIAQHFEWTYNGKNWTWDYSFPSDWYDYYKNKKHGPISIDYVTRDDLYIKQIAEMLKEEAKKNGYTKSEFAAAFIQSLGYVADTIIGYDEYPKYPLETLAEQNGDCEDTSYLSAAIISAMGVDVRLVLLPRHMAIAVAFSGSPDGYFYPSNNGRNYYYIETTGEGFRAGQIPDDHRYSLATLVEIPSGIESNIYPQYKKPCDYSSDFSAYYDGSNFYTDSQCNDITYCLLFKELYYNPQSKDFYWDSYCAQKKVAGCSKSTYYPGYFFNGVYWYYDSQCMRRANPR